MYGKISILALTFLALTSFNTDKPGLPLSRILQLYHKADALFHLPDSSPATDSLALTTFEQVIGELQRSPGMAGRDTLLFQSYLKKGVLLDVRYDYTGARDAYCRALKIPLQNSRQSDSLLFVAQVYAGTSYYNLNNFDSANYFLLRAESLAGRVHGQEDAVRLYNTLGALFYDNGNYQQSKNYFNRALEIIKARQPFNPIFAVSIETNIATSFYHLGLYQESLAIYNKILTRHIFTDPIYMNMGMAYSSLNKYEEALQFFRKVDADKIPGVFNEMGYAQLQLHRPDSAAWSLDQLSLRSARTGRSLNGLDLGINDLYRADLLSGRQEYRASLKVLQEAIILFSRDFTNVDIYANPSNFTGSFASYRLFDALFKKAALFERLYKMQPEEKYLAASYEAYKTTLSILRYIEKSYDTDDAKIFLKKKNGEVYQGALSVCLELARLHPKDNYLEQAFTIGEKSKASIVMANLEGRSFTRAGGVEDGLLQKERNIKYNIARLNVRSEAAADSKEMEDLAREKGGYEMELSHLQKELEKNGDYYKLKYEDASPPVKDLQDRLDDRQALVSFYAASGALHIFLLTRSSFNYARVDSLSGLQHNVEDWLTLLKTAENGRKFKGGAIGSRLYRQLIRPIQAALPGKDEWIIVPDGFLCFLPFESLPAVDGGGAEGGDGMAGGVKTLLETTTISYRFSSRLIGEGTSMRSGGDQREDQRGKVFAFAPFASQGSESFNRLPASMEEIAGLQGSLYKDSQATKQRFLREINKYPIVHLATHAVSSVNNAAASFIAFYPAKGSSIEDRLFLEELYGLDLNATKLVIISACESGQGELVSNEGVISLARAFAYAGCESTVNSLWKADDKATSFILQKFHIYLQKGYTRSKALRQAKLDYLGSDAINKSPAYWSHLVLIGDSGPLYGSTGNTFKWFLLITFLVISFGVTIFYRSRFFKWNGK